MSGERAPPRAAELLVPVLHAWDEMDNAAQRVLTAQPFQMTEAADKLDKARLAMRKSLQDYSLRLIRND